MGAKTKTKAKGKKGGMKKTAMYKSVSDRASCSVTRTLTPVNANQAYDLPNINLAAFARAAGIAQYYQRFRITGVQFTIKPVIDTVAITAGGVVYSKANFYHVVDKTGSLPDGITLEGLKQSGAIVKALDERPINVRWRPAVLAENQAGLAPAFAGPSGYSISPWLSTNQQANAAGAFAPNVTNHLGLVFYVEQQGNGGTNIATPFPCEITVEFEFTKPMIGNLTGVAPTVGATFAAIDASPDGVEGGSDGLTVPLAATRISE